MQGDKQQISQTITSIQDIPYRMLGDTKLRLDMLYPSAMPSSPMPVVVFIAGGEGAENNRKDNPTACLAERGFFTISITHRSHEQASLALQIEDAKAAIRWVRAHAEGCYLDPNRIGVWGHSFGGYLAALLGTSAGVPDLEDFAEYEGHSCRVSAVVSVGGPTDPSNIQDHEEPGQSGNSQGYERTHQQCDPTTRPNPLLSLQNGIPPFLIIHGEQDELVPIEQVELLDVTLRNAGANVSFIRLRGEGHQLSHVALEQTRQVASDFFATQLAR